MNSTDYASLLSHPETVNERQTDALETIVTEFPYFQSARALRLKGLYNQNSFQYNYALKVTAAYTTDRSVLFEFITSDSFTAIQKGTYEPKAVEVEESFVATTEVEEPVTAERPTDDELAKQSILTSIREAENRPETIIDTEAETTETVEAVTDEPIVAEEINAEEFGPIIEEPQFLPEAIAPVEFTPVEIIEFVPVETDDVIESELAEQIASEEETAPEIIIDEPTEAELTVETAVEETPIITEEPIITETIVEEIQPVIEETEAKLEIGKPLEFSKNETHSFAEWLQLSKLQPIVRDEAPVAETIVEETAAEIPSAAKTDDEKISKDTLIDRFIEANPKMPKINQDIQPVAIEQKDDHSALMTETLARVYLEQRKYQKAIQAYEILILKYPEKSTFFADRISEIKILQQNNTF